MSRIRQKQEVFCKKGVLRNFAEACNFVKKETLAQLFSCEFPKVFKNTFPDKAFLVAASCVSEWIYTFSFRTSCLKQTQYLKFKSTVTLWKYSRSNSSNKFSLLFCRLLDPFNENVHLQRGCVNIFLLVSKY